jgi:hypothetical protein
MNRTGLLSLLVMISLSAPASSQSVNSQCSQQSVSIPYLTKPDDTGWDVTFAKDAQILSKGPYVLGDGRDSGLMIIKYTVKKVVITLPHIEVNTCEGTGTIKYWYFKPKQVIGFEKNGRLFAYQVWGQAITGPDLNSQVIGMNTYFIFYDTHGDGIFDAVRIASGVGMPRVPDWVEKGSNASVRSRHR